jgi:MoxR-like ATPase
LTLGRAFVTPDDIRMLAAPVFRHRVLINFQAESEGLTTDDVVLKLLERIAPPASGLV